MIVAPLACTLAVAAVSVGGCSGCLSVPAERIDTSPRTLFGPQLYVAPGGADGGDCSAAEPCRQLERADALAVPGTTVNVAPGKYAPATLRASGTRRAPIRFV